MSGVKRLLDLPMYKQKIDLESRSNLLNFNSISMKPYARGYALRDVIFKNGQTTVSLAYKKGRKEKKLRYAIQSLRRDSRYWTENPSTVPETLIYY